MKCLVYSSDAGKNLQHLLYASVPKIATPHRLFAHIEKASFQQVDEQQDLADANIITTHHLACILKRVEDSTWALIREASLLLPDTAWISF